MGADPDKAAAGAFAAGLVQDGMRVGLGSGSTVAAFLPALAARGLELRCVATSVATEEQARALGLQVEPFDGPDVLARLDIAIDGADQIAPDGWLIKGGGRAHTREKIVAAAADRFVVIAGADKLYERLTPPVPLELHPFGAAATLARLAHARLRGGAVSPDGGLIADWVAPFEDPGALAAHLDADPGVVAHGLFPPALSSDLVIAGGGVAEHRPLRPPHRAQ